MYDVTTGFINQNNMCDFIVYYEGTIHLLECKAVHGNTLNFKSHIRQNQWDKLLKSSHIKGVNAGIICWFIDRDETVFLDIHGLDFLQKCEYKSFNITKDFNYAIPINGKKKKVFCEYDLKKFLEDSKLYES